MFVWLLLSAMAYAQETKNAVNDTLIYKQKYGIRLGADFAKIARTLIDSDYSGFEIIGDYRLTKKIYIAAEIGAEERSITNEVLNNTSKGSYIKGGIDINLYKNWLDMQNMIYSGFRVAASTFSQTLNNYTIYNVNNQYWDQQFSVAPGSEFKDLTAIWAEVQIGIKAELFNNFFAGINTQLRFLGTATTPKNFENLYIPGFGRTYDSGSFGLGFGFQLSYLIPIFKKDKIVVQEKEKA